MVVTGFNEMPILYTLWDRKNWDKVSYGELQNGAKSKIGKLSVTAEIEKMYCAIKFQNGISSVGFS